MNNALLLNGKNCLACRGDGIFVFPYVFHIWENETPYRSSKFYCIYQHAFKIMRHANRKKFKKMRKRQNKQNRYFRVNRNVLKNGRE